MTHREEDIRKLKACIERGWICRSCGGEGGDHTAGDCPNEGDDEPKWLPAFKNMLFGLESGHRVELTVAQRKYVADVHERLFDEPEYENAFSEGLVPQGRYGATPTPDVLKHLPKKPPRRP
jgi:hypothetical protein